MILDIPTPEEFNRTGLHLLNHAWSIGFEIASEVRFAHIDDETIASELSEEYWREAQPALNNAFTLIHQAQEMELKGKIASFSPYLLIQRDPRYWPAKCDEKNISFSKFRMVDSIDLVKIYNSFCQADLRLDKEFMFVFDQVREERNSIIHSGRSIRAIGARELFTYILKIFACFYREKSWISQRKYYLENDRISVLHSSDHSIVTLLGEFETAADLLTSSDVKRFFGLTKARRYLCPECNHECESIGGDLYYVSQLKPNSPSATTVHCLVCGQDTEVLRVRCGVAGCKSNVICKDAQWGYMCLICGTEREAIKGTVS